VIDLEKLVRAAFEMKPLPASVTRLAAIISNKRSSLDDIIDVITFDPVLTAKVIRAANSVFSAPRVPITTVDRAVVRVGTGAVLALATASSVAQQLNRACPAYGLSEGDLWHHSVTAALAAQMAQAFCDAPLPPESFTAALLHDIGKLVLSRFLDAEAVEMVQYAKTKWQLTDLAAEKRVLRVHHGQVGGLIAKRWKFPESIIKGIQMHHTPAKGGIVLCDVVHLADALAKAVKYSEEHGGKVAQIQVQSGSVQRVGLRVGEVDRLCARISSRLGEVLDLYSS
jgi:putative nucleotidyltransferase with HDIG domain